MAACMAKIWDPATDEIALFAETCEFFTDAACTGTSLGVSSRTSVLEDEGGVWVFLTGTITTPAGTASAFCGFAAEALGATTDFDLYIDDLYYGQEPGIFADGFESGNVSAWSSSVP